MTATPQAPAHNDPSDAAFINYIDSLRKTLGEQFAYDATSGDYRIRLVGTDSSGSLGPVSTAGSLVTQGDGLLWVIGDNRFDGGTRVEAGTLSIYGNLFSDVDIATGATVDLTGDIIGDVDNHGIFDPTEPGNGWYDDYYDSDIFGNYSQSPEGMLRVWFGLQGDDTATPLLTVTGTATLDGTLQFRSSGYIPADGYLEWIIHAYGGVNGQFARWTTDSHFPLFITGDLQYSANDVYLLATRVSTQATMAAAAKGDILTLRTAGYIDDAFGAGDALAAMPDTSLSTAQRQFLQSAASIQNIRDYDQAVTTFDSLSGHGHVAVVEALSQQATTSGLRSSAHIDALRSGSPAGFWSAQPAMVSTSVGTFTDAQTTGYDQWLGERLLLGSSFGWSHGNLRFNRSGGSAHSRSPQWNAYLLRTGDNGSYLMGEAGYAHHQLDLDRSIDLGEAVHRARSERNLEVTHASVEAGRGIRVGGGQLTPFVAVSHAALRGDGFIEQGDSGFELIAQASLHQRTSGDAGFRYARHWRWGEDRWMQLDFGTRYQYLLGASDDMRAAFTGTPGVGFDLYGLPHGRDNSWLEMNLTGGRSDRWSWLLSYDNRADNQAVSLGVALGF